MLKWLILVLTLSLCVSLLGQVTSPGVPGFHHLHLNSVNPSAAIDFYVRQFPTTMKTTFAGQPALKTGQYYVLFTKVSTPPKTSPQTAIWHFGWHVTDVRKNLATYQARNDVKLLPLYIEDGGGSVFVSSDTWPGVGGALGLTRAQIATAKAEAVRPAGGAGFAYLQGPDNALVEYQGDMPRERFNHVHMYQEEPLCAQAWYVNHLNAAPRAGTVTRSETDCKVPRGEPSWPALEKEGTIREPAGGALFDDVAINWYANQATRPLAPTRGNLYDHFALSVANLDAWIAKLQGEGVKFLTTPYKLGEMNAVMIEGPSREAIELVEVKK
jgi:catechol 2,3-dioxygenase-like lactoylglutathione lyase family enzyme